MFNRLLCAAIASMAWGSAAATPQQETTDAPYVLTSFSNGNATTMSVYVSDDAATFRPLDLTAFSPPTGLIRDPSIIRRADGWYHVVYTTDWNNDEIGGARSRDLTHW